MNRTFLIVIVLLLAMASNAQPLKQYAMVSLMEGESTFADDSNGIFDLPIWGYGWDVGEISEITLPGPTIYAKQGDSVHVRLFNPSFEGHTIHLHGLDVDEANDGVPQHTGFILQDESFTYRFKATHAGNFLYHCHVTTTMHLTLGMYGMVIVYPSDSSNTIYDNGPTYNRQYEFLLSEMDARWNADYTQIGGFLTFNPDLFLVNGKNRQLIYNDTNLAMEGEVGDQLLMRVLNVGYRVNRLIFPEEVNAVVHTSDGRVLAQPFESDTLIVYPGERFNVLAEVLDETSTYVSIDYLDPYRMNFLGREYIPLNDADFSYIPYDEVFSGPDSVGQSVESVEQESSLRLYPVPADQQVIVQHTKEIRSIQLYDLSGRSIETRITKSQTFTEVSTASLNSGIFFLEAVFDDGEREVKRLVIKH